MFSKPHCPVIAIEEHYWDEELANTYVGGEAGRPGEQQKRLVRFRPACASRRWTRPASTSRCSRTARRRRRSCRPNRGRADAAGQRSAARAGRQASASLRGLRGLPTAVPAAAADELERTVKARLQGRHDPRPRQRHVPRRQAVLADLSSAPNRSTCRSICIPSMPHPAVMDAYYKDYVKDFPDW